MNCKTCGTIVPPDAAFCPECGTPLSQADVHTTDTLPPAIPIKKHILGQAEQSKFFTFFQRFILAMEQSNFFKKPLYGLYILFAALNILVPVYLLFLLISKDILNQMGVGGFMIWLIFAFAGWMGFQLWWNRKDNIALYFQQGDDFFAIPLFSHYIQTTGEWLGMTLAIIGAGTSLVVWLFLSGNNSGSGFGFPLPMQSFGIAGVIISPIIGFTIILVTKVVAELYRALAAIANNTKYMASNK